VNPSSAVARAGASTKAKGPVMNGDESKPFDPSITVHHRSSRVGFFFD
jgi:hypothetical protein